MTDPIVPQPPERAAWPAIARGLRGRCPACGAQGMFARFLKVRPCCEGCGLQLDAHQADDFPAYISIFVTGHLLAPVLIVLASDFALSSTAILAIILPLAVAFMLLTLQPAKGAVIALQWWHGMHGFRAERRPQPGDDA